jgi:hypothetical protein
MVLLHMPQLCWCWACGQIRLTAAAGISQLNALLSCCIVLLVLLVGWACKDWLCSHCLLILCATFRHGLRQLAAWPTVRCPRTAASSCWGRRVWGMLGGTCGMPKLQCGHHVKLPLNSVLVVGQDYGLIPWLDGAVALTSVHTCWKARHHSILLTRRSTPAAEALPVFGCCNRGAVGVSMPQDPLPLWLQPLHRHAPFATPCLVVLPNSSAAAIADLGNIVLISTVGMLPPPWWQACLFACLLALTTCKQQQAHRNINYAWHLPSNCIVTT